MIRTKRAMRRPTRAGNSDTKQHEPPVGASTSSDSLSKSLSQNEATIQSSFGKSPDLTMRRLGPGHGQQPEILVVYLASMADKRLVSETVIAKIPSLRDIAVLPETWSDLLKRSLLSAGAVQEAVSTSDLLAGLVVGDTAVLVEGSGTALICSTRGFPSRQPDSPQTEPTIHGPKEGFVESLMINVSLLRRRISHESLRFESFVIGRRSRTHVSLAYISTLAQDGLIAEAQSRLSRVDVDALTDSANLEELITDNRFTPFPTMLRTERPDRINAGLLEGRIAIIVDGSPEVLLAPITFTMLVTSPEDYYDSYFVGSAIRVLRWATLAVSLLLPSLYVAVTTIHQELLPTPLILAIAAQREGVPFPAVVEALMMETLFEVLREASVRLPQIIGPAVSIIGALVLGDAAIRAGLVSPAMVIVVATTGIASFTTPSYNLGTAVRLLRFGVIVLAAAVGLYGVVISVITMLVHLVTLRSFGTPYLAPLAPLVTSDLKDSMARAPQWAMKTRPALPGSKDDERQGSRGE